MIDPEFNIITKHFVVEKQEEVNVTIVGYIDWWSKDPDFREKMKPKLREITPEINTLITEYKIKDKHLSSNLAFLGVSLFYFRDEKETKKRIRINKNYYAKLRESHKFFSQNPSTIDIKFDSNKDNKLQIKDPKIISKIIGVAKEAVAEDIDFGFRPKSTQGDIGSKYLDEPIQSLNDYLASLREFPREPGAKTSNEICNFIARLFIIYKIEKYKPYKEGDYKNLPLNKRESKHYTLLRQRIKGRINKA